MTMGDFNRDRGSSGSRSFGKRDFGSRGGGFDKGGDRPMHKTVCSKCGKQCEVPFIPSGSRPVFCSDCFQSNRISNPIRSESNYPRHSNFEDRGNSQVTRSAQPQYQEQFSALNAKLDKILKILEPKIVAVAAPAETPKAPEVTKVIKIKKATKKSTPAKKKE